MPPRRSLKAANEVIKAPKSLRSQSESQVSKSESQISALTEAAAMAGVASGFLISLASRCFRAAKA
jgi:hypothetical protein